MRVGAKEKLLEHFNVSRETLQSLSIYAEQLEKWNKKINLVGPKTIKEIWCRHILDSAQLLNGPAQNVATWTDLGTGAGFPGLVVAILAKDRRPTLDMALIESDSRKCEFLRHISRLTGTPVSIENTRIEEAEIRRSDVVSARALAGLPKLLEYSYPKVKKDGICLFLKGAEADTELTNAANFWHIECEKVPSITDSDGVILQVRNIRHV